MILVFVFFLEAQVWLYIPIWARKTKTEKKHTRRIPPYRDRKIRGERKGENQDLSPFSPAISPSTQNKRFSYVCGWRRNGPRVKKTGDIPHGAWRTTQGGFPPKKY